VQDGVIDVRSHHYRQHQCGAPGSYPEGKQILYFEGQHRDNKTIYSSGSMSSMYNIDTTRGKIIAIDLFI
jgi:hypothetical protein